MLPTSTEVNSRFDGWKCSLPSSSGSAMQRGDQRRRAADRIVGALRIGDVALLAVTMSVPLSEPRRPILIVSPSVVDIARLAENAVVESLAALGRPLQQLDRAVDGDAFLVAGDQERDRALLRLAAVGGEMIERGGERAGDAALHVDRAAAKEFAVGDLAGEGRMRPGRLVARRHHIGVAGEHQMRRGRCRCGHRGFRRPACRLAERHALHGKAGAARISCETGQRAAFGRRHRRAAQKLCRDCNRISRHDARCFIDREPAWLFRSRFSLFGIMCQLCATARDMSSGSGP